MTVINKSAEDLYQKVDIHRRLLSTILEKGVNEVSLKRVPLPANPSGTDNLKQAVTDAILVLEETRRSFKSKKLEALRKRLTQALIESR